MSRLNDLYLQEFTDIRRGRRGADRLFTGALTVSLVLFAILAVGVKKVKLTGMAATTAAAMQKMKVSFNLAPDPEKIKIAKPLDLTRKTKLAGQDNIEARPAADPNAAPARAVYGLRRIFATGLGSGEGGGGSNTLVAKLGNTLDKAPDTLTATVPDLKGKLVSVTTVTFMPKLKVTIKPIYSPEMLKNRVEGEIRAKLLIDVDGTVKQVIILHDIGYGSREAAIAAFSKCVFEPAKMGDIPVAVWIPIKFTFKMLDS
jgi:hypothetical protein